MRPAELNKAERVLDELIYHAEQNASAANDADKQTWAAHARRCREARELIMRTGTLSSSTRKEQP